MELPKIKYIRVVCPECQKEYEIKLKLKDSRLVCYKCMMALKMPSFFEEKDIDAANAAIDAANAALDMLHNRSVDVTFDGDGFSVNQLPFATTPPCRTMACSGLVKGAEQNCAKC